MGQQLVRITLPDAAATHALGWRLGQRLPPGSVLLLEGNLGSGKTTLVQGIGAGLGIADAIASPTFTLINEYLEGRIPLYHVDLYRLTPAETDSLYLETYWDGEEVEPGILAIEWADRLSYLPLDPIQLLIEYDADEGRQVTLTVPESYATDVWEALKSDEILANEV
jgi:tRNA threonylcarbamoyladenosine biosynthesis protein TsaE